MLPKSSSTFLKIAFYALVALIPLGTRHLFISGDAPAYLYGTEILFAAVIVGFFAIFHGIFWQKPKFLILFLVCAGASVLWAGDKAVALWWIARLLLLALGSLVTAKMLRTGFIKETYLFGVLAGSAVLQSLIALAQFWKQASLGLGFLGEPSLAQATPGLAKVIIEGGPVIRGYGTFPHPNILAGFLLLGLFALYYLWLRRPSAWKFFDSFKNLGADLLIGLSIFAVTLGLLVTFSRTGWAIATVMTLGVGIAAAASAERRRQGVRLLLLMAAVVSVMQAQFGVYIAARAQVSAAEPAVTLRSAYNRIGLDLIAGHPLGVGIGNQVLYADRSGEYDKLGLIERWQHQPIHNIYLLIASEIGILGLLAFVMCIGGVLLRRPLLTVPKAMLLALLAFGLMEHFLWTSVPGQLMLWLVIGIVIGV